MNKRQKILNLNNPDDFKKFMDIKEEWLNKEFRKAVSDTKFKPVYTQEDLK